MSDLELILFLILGLCSVFTVVGGLITETITKDIEISDNTKDIIKRNRDLIRKIETRKLKAQQKSRKTRTYSDARKRILNKE